ncbi:DNA alkylation repair protein [Flavobacterium granuli]|uniref:3-methyladenine DNA glycosylase AlkD n=1 Tax=Flavobacterium granuli TaxID=280093 RepID=A0ABU1RXC1_9FLAO|nr:DNA alkylation repair protein [Flavobacterium granuli]MDR6843413.1 3-methyladenine DNA glycosylase AlkD [Flavobacterium granuli]
MVAIDTFRKIALSFPEVTEDPHFEKISFRVKKKIFATYDDKNKRACVKLSQIDQSIFSAADKTIIFPVDNKWGKQGWTLIEMKKVREDLFIDSLITAYCEIAPKKLADQIRPNEIETNTANINSETDLTASRFIEKLSQFKSDEELGKVKKYFKGNDNKTKAFGVKFGDIFKTAEDFTQMPLAEIDILLDSDFYEIRMGAVSIMDFQAKHKKTTTERKKELFEFYLKRHDRLNNWDFVDRGAYNIIGEYLLDKPREILYQLANLGNIWERRTSIVSTYAFIKKGQIDDTFKIAEILLNDKEELINKAVGSWIREAGKKDKTKLIDFLNRFAPTMPRVTLRYAIEKLDKQEKDFYLKLK